MVLTHFRQFLRSEFFFHHFAVFFGEKNMYFFFVKNKKMRNSRSRISIKNENIRKNNFLRHFVALDDIIPELDTFECAPTMDFFHLKISKSAK